MMHLLVAIAWLFALAWVYKFAESVAGMRKLADLTQPKYDKRTAGPALAVIVPARNEEADIGACLLSLLEQDYDNLQVIAVDDRSDDETGVLMDEVAASADGRLQVMHIRELPDGWLGKTHAMATAAREAIDRYNARYLLFTDGDVFFAPGILRRAVARAVEVDADHCVVMPTLVAKTAGEAAVLSFIQAMSLWAARPWRVADPRAKRDAIGVGAFNLVRADAYREIGGFEATPMEVLEDLYLGRRMKWAGMKQDVAIAPGMVRLHWAAGARGIANGMTKNIFAVFRFRAIALLAVASWLAFFSVGVVAFLFLPATQVAAGITLLALWGVYAVSSRLGGIPAGYAILFPFATAVVVYAMLRSMLVTLRYKGVTWRGTFYRIDQLRSQMVRRPR